ncbi:hypothetical protein BURK1_00595 [Burkholderiales bacterium]|nr:hypothetical protein BURK1_00595 [Burkholderiales bacterium]
MLPDGPAVALYFGSEFCEDRLPDLDEASAFCAVARDRGWEPTLLTPLVSPEGLRAVDQLAGALGAAGFRPAVVFNDWGVLGLLRERHAALPRRAGRLVNRSLRDPRAYRDAPGGTATHDVSRHARMRGMLRRLGVAALETDADLEGGYLGEGRGSDGTGLSRALHLPYTYAASGRGCPLKAALYGDEGGFAKAFADRCPAPCRGKPLPVHRPDSALPHWRGGNTIFYELPHEAARSWLVHADRVVVHGSASP